MKILIIDLGVVWGGQEIYSYNLMKKYKENNHYVISISSQPKFKDIANEFYEVSPKYSNFFKLSKKIMDISKDADLIHFNGNRALYLSLVCKKTKPFIGTKHLPYFVGGEKDLKSIVSQYLGNIFFKNIDTLICVANATYKDLPKSIQKKSVVIYNGVDIGLNRTISKIENNLKICYIARFTKHKGIIQVLDIVKKLYDKHNITIELTIAGKGELEEYIDSFIKKHPELAITNLGFINNPQDVYANSHLGILLSTHEGMPLNILEAFSAGLVFISYDIPGVDEVIKSGYNGYLIETHNDNEVLNTIKKLHENRDLILQMSKNANNEYNKKYSLQTMAEKTLDVYNQILNIKGK